MATRTTKQKRSSALLRCGIREAKARLSSLLDDVRSGREILITDRGKPVAKLVAVTSHNLSLAEWVETLERRHWIEPEAARSRRPLPPPTPMPLPDGVAQRFLDEDRYR